MKRKIIFSIICFIVLLICGVICYFLFDNKDNMNISNKGENNGILSNALRESDGNIHVLSSIDDEVVGDSMWCGTFQLVWNDMVNEVVKQDVVFNPQLEIVKNLNKQTFTNKELSPNSYYSKFGLLTLDLKSEIEKGVKEKFDENSNILDQLDWSNVPQRDDYYEGKDEKKYGFYAMLKKIFKFEKIFDQLNNGKFGDKYDNIKYFGIDDYSSNKLYKQVYVYYYNSDSDFAVALKTKEGEEVILARGIGGRSFMDIYYNLINNREKYEGNHNFTSFDYLKVPELNIVNVAKFEDLKNKKFYAKNGDICEINEAVQSIELRLDKEGGKIKSEAMIELATFGSAGGLKIEGIEHRYFYFDKPYVMFLKETDKDLPYFAAQISDITLFQN